MLSFILIHIILYELGVSLMVSESIGYEPKRIYSSVYKTLTTNILHFSLTFITTSRKTKLNS